MLRLMRITIILQKHFLEILYILKNVLLRLSVDEPRRIKQELKGHLLRLLYIKTLGSRTRAMPLTFRKLDLIIQYIRFRVDQRGKRIPDLMAIGIIRVVIRKYLDLF